MRLFDSRCLSLVLALLVAFVSQGVRAADDAQQIVGPERAETLLKIADAIDANNAKIKTWQGKFREQRTEKSPPSLLPIVIGNHEFVYDVEGGRQRSSYLVDRTASLKASKRPAPAIAERFPARPLEAIRVKRPRRDGKLVWQGITIMDRSLQQGPLFDFANDPLKGSGSTGPVAERLSGSDAYGRRDAVFDPESMWGEGYDTVSADLRRRAQRIKTESSASGSRPDFAETLWKVKTPTGVVYRLTRYDAPSERLKDDFSSSRYEFSEAVGLMPIVFRKFLPHEDRPQSETRWTWMKVDGILVPRVYYVEEVKWDGRQTREWTFSDVRLNAPIKPEVFDDTQLASQKGDRFVDRAKKELYYNDGSGLKLVK